jgi:hypothetical protein
MTYEETDVALATTSAHARWEPGSDYNCLDYRSLMVEAVVVCQSETKIIQFMTNEKIKTTSVKNVYNLPTRCVRNRLVCSKFVNKL